MSFSNKPARVLHVVSAMHRGGAETMIMNIYRKIDRDKVQFDFITHRNEKCDYDDEIVSLGGRIFYCRSLGQSGPLKYVYNLSRIIKEQGPYKAVHAHTDFQTGFVALAARLVGVKVRITHSHTTAYRLNPGYIDKLQLAVFRGLIRLNSTCKVACGKEAARFLYGDSLLRRGKVSILNNGINLELYESNKEHSSDNLKNIMGISSDKVVIGHIGRFCKEKNHEFILELAEYMKNEGRECIFLLIGDGPLRNEIEAKAEEKQLLNNIRFLGIRNDIQDLMKILDVLIMPSLCEGVPLVLIEAQASALPCVISSNITDEVDLGLGLLQPIGLHEPLKMWSDTIFTIQSAAKPAWEEIKEKIIKNNYDVENNIKKVFSLYRIDDSGEINLC